MQGDLIVIAVGLVIALAFSTLIKAFTDNVITPLVNAAGGGGRHRARRTRQRAAAQLRRVHLGVIYFIIFMAVIYFVIVVPYRAYAARRGVTVFGDPAPVEDAARSACPTTFRWPHRGVSTAVPHSAAPWPDSGGALPVAGKRALRSSTIGACSIARAFSSAPAAEATDASASAAKLTCPEAVPTGETADTGATSC